MAQTLHICIFNTDIPVPGVSTTRAHSYGAIFQSLLYSALTRVSPTLTLRTTEYDSRALEFPSSLADVDLILITGSIHSSYDDIPWIHRLEQYIIDVYAEHPRVKWFGSCFGHQLICQALLKGYGVRVDADERGWELGVQCMTMGSKFRNDFSKCPTRLANLVSVKEEMRLQFIHGDFVVIPNPEELPETWSVIGSTPWCANQGMYESGRVLTFQGHFEFDRFINSETLKTFFAKREPVWLEEALKTVDADDDAEEAAEMVIQFVMQKTPAEQSKTHATVGGLVTPPEEEL